MKSKFKIGKGWTERHHDDIKYLLCCLTLDEVALRAYVRRSTTHAQTAAKFYITHGVNFRVQSYYWHSEIEDDATHN